MINPQTGDIVDFSLVQPGIFGDKRIEVRVLIGSAEFEAARLIDPQLLNKHTAFYPYFQNEVGNVNDPAAYKYLVVSGSNGQPEVIGLPWILESTYKTVTSRTGTIVIQNFREEFRSPLQKFLADLGAQYIITTSDKS